LTAAGVVHAAQSILPNATTSWRNARLDY